MYAFLSGSIASISPTLAVLDIQGIGYEIHINTQTYYKIKDLKNTKLFTYFHKSDHGDALYGFSSLEDKALFLHLLSVNKVGPSTAQVILSTFESIEIVQAIQNGNIGKLSTIKGIGKKTAERIIVELRDKVLMEDTSVMETSIGAITGVKQEAENALLSLGFSKAQINGVHKKMSQNGIIPEDLEKYLKEALSLLSN